MTKHLYIQTMRILLVCALVQLAGCSRREPDSLPEESMYGEVYLNINLNIDSGESYSRAGRPDNEEDLVDGVGLENAINTLHLFWKENDAWRVVELNTSDFIFTGNKGNVKIAFDKNDYPTLEGIEMWLGANLSSEQADAFMGFTGIYTLETTSDWANELAPMYSDFSGRDDIAMFCVESSVTTLVSSAPDEEYSISFDLKRLVAKVMVACKEGTSGYAKISDTANDFQGWIKRNEVLYTLNGVNRSTYVRQVVVGNDYDANVIDPNPNLKNYTDLYNDEKEYLSLVNSHFYYYDVTDLMLKNGLYKEAQPVDDNGSYTDGIYCPENTFSPNINDDATTLESNPSAWGMITSVSIKAKFTPRMLYVEGGLFDFILGRNDVDEGTSSIVGAIKGEVEKINGTIDNNRNYQVNCLYENAAKAFLKYSLIYNGFLQEEIGTGNGFPDETYFYHADQNEYYTYGAAKLAIEATDNTTELGNYRPYYDGWGFYYTYIDNRLEKNGDFVFYKHGQVERNRYYILTINSFSNPGASAGNPSYVEVNTEMIPWKNGGQGNITLE